MCSQYPVGLDEGQQKLLTDGAKLSQLAYSDPATMSSQTFEVLTRVQGTPEYVTCPDCDAQCYLVNYKPVPVKGMPDNVLTICARGTTSLVDWCCDAEVNQVVFKDANQNVVYDKKKQPGRVHAGFYRQFVGLFKLMDTRVKKHLSAGGTLFCVGHSLGSAASAIAAVNYGLAFPGQVWYAGYGVPRVFNDVLAGAFDGCVKGKWRVKNAADPVASIVPPIEYKHAGSEVHIGTTDNYPDLPMLFDVGDHDIKNYITGLQKQGGGCTESKSVILRNWIQNLLGV